MSTKGTLQHALHSRVRAHNPLPNLSSLQPRKSVAYPQLAPVMKVRLS